MSTGKVVKASLVGGSVGQVHLARHMACTSTACGSQATISTASGMPRRRASQRSESLRGRPGKQELQVRRLSEGGPDLSRSKRLASDLLASLPLSHVGICLLREFEKQWRR